MIFRNSFASSPRIGLPSADRFPILERAMLILAAEAKSGMRMREWIFLVLPLLVKMQLTSAERMKNASDLQDRGTSCVW